MTWIWKKPDKQNSRALVEYHGQRAILLAAVSGAFAVTAIILAIIAGGF